jgi:hypothetical protein
MNSFLIKVCPRVRMNLPQDPAHKHSLQKRREKKERVTRYLGRDLKLYQVVSSKIHKKRWIYSVKSRNQGQRAKME